MPESFKDESRKNWHQTEGKPSDDRLKLGCLQRIADATETMARNYSSLISKRNRYEGYYKDQQARREKAERSNAALRGQITKLNGSVAELEQQLEEARKRPRPKADVGRICPSWPQFLRPLLVGGGPRLFSGRGVARSRRPKRV